MRLPPEPEPSAPHGAAEAVRHRVVQIASEVSSSGRIDESTEIRLYLALLQDGLPVYARAMATLTGQVGHGDVHENLDAAVQATIDFYRRILATKVAIFTQPAQLARLRRLMYERGLSPRTATEEFAAYLAGEQRLGRVAAEVDPLATSRLLQGAAVNYVFTTLLLGQDGSDRADYVHSIVAGARVV